MIFLCTMRNRWAFVQARSNVKTNSTNLRIVGIGWWLWCQTLTSNGACIDWLAIVTKVCDENLDRMINELSFARCSSLHSLLAHFVFQTCCATFVVFALLISRLGARCSFNMFNMQFKRFARNRNLIIIKKKVNSRSPAFGGFMLYFECLHARG